MAQTIIKNEYSKEVSERLRDYYGALLHDGFVHNRGWARRSVCSDFVASCRVGNMEAVKFFRNVRVPPSHNNYEGLYEALVNGHWNVAQYLIKIYFSPPVVLWSDDSRLLRAVCRRNRLDIAIKLYDSYHKTVKMDPSACSNQIIREAAGRGNTEMVRWCIKIGCDPKVRSYEPFKNACRNGHLETAKLLYQLEAYPKRGGMKLMFMSYAGGYIEVAQWLIIIYELVPPIRHPLFEWAMANIVIEC